MLASVRKRDVPDALRKTHATKSKTHNQNLYYICIIRTQAVGFGVVLMDSKTSNIYKLDNKKKISVTRIDRAFKVGIYLIYGVYLSLILDVSRHFPLFLCTETFKLPWPRT